MARLVEKSLEELELMRVAGRIVAGALSVLRDSVKEGIATQELDRIGETFIRDHGAVPSFKGYHGYPATICASVNEEIVHGIPGERCLKAGDIISLDIGAIWQGYHGDAAISVAVGEIPEALQTLMTGTEAALAAGISECRPGRRLGDVSHAIERVAREAGLEVIREYGGHGIGRDMHEAPNIRNWGRASTGLRLEQGMTFCLEPMFTVGGYETLTLEDGWTVVTADGSVSAHFEHALAVMDGEPEVLTSLKHE